jgi:uncharacterized protein
MSLQLMLAVVALMVATSFLSGIFGMAGGLILIGVLLALLPLPEAMALHAVTQMASNGWRSLLWAKHIRWRSAAMFLAGAVVAFAVWSLWRYVAPKPLALILLGVSPFLVRLFPADLKPNPERLSHGLVYGSGSMSLMLLAGVSGPLIDTFFLGGTMERRQIVATKSVCQFFCHGAKFLYFGGLVDQAAGLDPVMAAAAIVASMIGTSAAKPVLDRLTDTQYRLWANRIVTTIAIVYLVQGGALLLWPRVM